MSIFQNDDKKTITGKEFNDNTLYNSCKLYMVSEDESKVLSTGIHTSSTNSFLVMSELSIGAHPNIATEELTYSLVKFPDEASIKISCDYKSIRGLCSGAYTEGSGIVVRKFREKLESNMVNIISTKKFKYDDDIVTGENDEFLTDVIMSYPSYWGYDFLEKVLNQSPKLIECCIKCHNGAPLIAKIKNRTPEMNMAAVKYYLEAFAELEPQEMTLEICEYVLKKNGLFLKYVPSDILDKNNYLCKLAVRENGASLEYVENITNEIIVDAIKNNFNALQYVEDQTDEICETAVSSDYRALKFVKNKTENIIKIATQQNIDALNFVDNNLISENVIKSLSVEQIKNLIEKNKRLTEKNKIWY